MEGETQKISIIYKREKHVNITIEISMRKGNVSDKNNLMYGS